MSTNPVVTVTDELLEELEQLASKATPGPWEFANKTQYDGEKYWLIQTKAEKDGWEIAELRMDVPHNEGNASFMAGANPATILALLHHIRTMQQELKAAHISVDNCELFRKDAERLDRLDGLCEAYGFEVHEGNRWVIDGPFRNIRDAIDSLPSTQPWPLPTPASMG